MMRSLYSGVTGLKNHQTRMDVIGNNIANVNTIGYKASRTVFQDLYSQTLTPASAPATALGGTNPRQVGLGVTLAGIDILFTQSAQQYTGKTMDLYIDGDGFFKIQKGPEEYYTRAGNLMVDEAGTVLSSDGYFVQGEIYTPVVTTTGGVTTVTYTGPDPTADPPAEGAPTSATAHLAIDPNTYYYVAVDKNGFISAKDRATDAQVVLGKINVYTFSNQEGLSKVGGNKYRETVNSGVPVKRTAGEGGAGSIVSGSIEMSNVDVANEFTDMIVTQRGFQANSRVITVSDQMLEELVNIKR